MRVRVRLNGRRVRAGRLWQFSRYLFLLIGSGALSYTGCFYLDQYWHQYRTSQTFDRARAALVIESKRVVSGSGQTFPARLSIDRLHLTTMIEEGVGERTLGHAAGHIPSTALPGQPGNVGVAGHRDTLFRSLRGIKKHDRIVISTLSNDYDYEVTGTAIVNPRNVAVLAATQGENTLTLVTCYPFYYVGSAPDRFIVKARQVSPMQATPATSQPVVSYPVTNYPVNGGRTTRNPNDADHNSSVQKVRFDLVKSHSREVAPGISMGLTGTDVRARRANGWMWVMPDRRTIWLRDQSALQPVVFYRDGRRRELVITNVAADSVSGYLTVAGDRR